MIVTVTQLNNFIKGMLDSEPMLSGIMIKGEVANLNLNRDTVNFSLRDDAGQIDCFCPNQKIIEFANGDEIVITASPSYYGKGGKLSWYVLTAKPSDKLGEMYKRFLALKEKLSKEGCFDQQIKKQISRYARCIGIVTSPSGAVINDLKKVIWERNPSVELKLYPVKVQGEGAEEEIANGINYFSTSNVDTVIVARGGGSQTELMPFNSEIVVRALNKCKKPTISAVGHESDFTLCDLAADVRAATPSVAGELSTINSTELKKQVKRILNEILQKTMDKSNANYKRVQLNLANLRFLQIQKISNSKNQIISTLIKMKEKTSASISDVSLAAQVQLEKLNGKNPLLVLKQGYAAVSKDNIRIKTAKTLAKGDKVRITFHDGQVNATVDGVKDEN